MQLVNIDGIIIIHSLLFGKGKLILKPSPPGIHIPMFKISIRCYRQIAPHGVLGLREVKDEMALLNMVLLGP